MTYHVPELTWVTPSGSIANLEIGYEQSVTILAVDTTNNGAVLNYQVIGGSLPPGMLMDSYGVISGTPIYSSPSNNTFTTLVYDFVVRVSTTNPLTPVDRNFSIILNNNFGLITSIIPWG
jgi:Putative Ig domain